MFKLLFHILTIFLFLIPSVSYSAKYYRMDGRLWETVPSSGGMTTGCTNKTGIIWQDTQSFSFGDTLYIQTVIGDLLTPGYTYLRGSDSRTQMRSDPMLFGLPSNYENIVNYKVGENALGEPIYEQYPLWETCQKHFKESGTKLAGYQAKYQCSCLWGNDYRGANIESNNYDEYYGPVNPDDEIIDLEKLIPDEPEDNLICEDYTATIADHSYGKLLDCFIQRMKTTSIMGGLASYSTIQSSGSGVYSFDAGDYGEQKIDYTDIKAELSILGSVFIIVALWFGSRITLRSNSDE